MSESLHKRLQHPLRLVLGIIWRLLVILGLCYIVFISMTYLSNGGQ